MNRKTFKQPTPEVQLLTTTQAAIAIGLSPSTVLRALKDGKLKSFKTPGGHYRVSLEEAKKILGTVK